MAKGKYESKLSKWAARLAVVAVVATGVSYAHDRGVLDGTTEAIAKVQATLEDGQTATIRF